MNQKGQVTLFVILGLVLVIGIASYFYIANKVQELKIDVPRLTGHDGQVQSYVEGCIAQVGRMGLAELGRHGGYINPINRLYTPIDINYNNIDQTESDLAFLNIANKDSAIAYWYYAKSVDDCWHCEVSSLSPPIWLMEAQLGLYVDENLQTCLDNYALFKDEGYEILSITNSSTLVTILESDVDFLTNYTIEITQKSTNTVSYIEEFYTKVDVPLLKYYALAINITQNQINNHYLDSYAMYLLGQYSGLDENKLPPISAYQSGYNLIFWSKLSVRKNFESLLSTYIQFFKIAGTANDVNKSLTTNPLEQRMFTAMRLPMFDEKAIETLGLENIEITHSYLGQPIYMNVRPSNGQIIGTELVGNPEGAEYAPILTSVPPEQNYDFFYDISYPVIVSIQDTTPGKEYIFMFALQGNVKENILLSDWLKGYGTIPWDTSNMKVFNNIPAGTTGIDPQTGEVIDYEALDLNETKVMFCDDNQKVSGDIEFSVYDSITDNPIDAVRIRFNCGDYAGCFVGSTVYDELLNKASFKAKLPLCLNGYLELSKEGYNQINVPLTTEYAKSEHLDSVYMEPLIKKNITVQKYMLERMPDDKGYVFNEPLNLTGNDSVMMVFTQITDDKLAEPWTQTIILGKDGINSNVIELVRGIYEVNVQLIDYNGVSIPKECDRICTENGVIFKKDCKEWKYIPENDINMEVALWGGIGFNKSNPFIVTSEDLISDSYLHLYIVRLPDPRCLDDMNEPTTIGKLAIKYRSLLTPVFRLRNDTMNN